MPINGTWKTQRLPCRDVTQPCLIQLVRLGVAVDRVDRKLMASCSASPRTDFDKFPQVSPCFTHSIWTGLNMSEYVVHKTGRSHFVVGSWLDRVFENAAGFRKATKTDKNIPNLAGRQELRGWHGAFDLPRAALLAQSRHKAYNRSPPIWESAVTDVSGCSSIALRFCWFISATLTLDIPWQVRNSNLLPRRGLMCSFPRFDVPNAWLVDVFNVIMAAECGLPADCEQVALQAGEKYRVLYWCTQFNPIPKY